MQTPTHILWLIHLTYLEFLGTTQPEKLKHKIQINKPTKQHDSKTEVKATFNHQLENSTDSIFKQLMRNPVYVEKYNFLNNHISSTFMQYKVKESNKKITHEVHTGKCS